MDLLGSIMGSMTAPPGMSDKEKEKRKKASTDNLYAKEEYANVTFLTNLTFAKTTQDEYPMVQGSHSFKSRKLNVKERQ
jgi:hypothetical protein